MAPTITITLLALFLSLVDKTSTHPGSRSQGNEEQKRFYAVVFLNRGHVSGGVSSNIGVFRRRPGDTLWTNIYRPNLFAFSIKLWEGEAAKRYYVAGGNGLHRSTDGGRTWSVLTDWRIEEVLSVAMDPIDSAVLYIGTPFGVFKSTDDGRRWQRKMKGMSKWFVKNVAIDRKDRRTLFAAAEDDLYRTSDGCEHWVPLRVGARGILTVAQHPDFPNHFLVGTEDNGIRVSVDGGRSWKVGRGLPNTAFYAITVSSNKRTIYAGGYRTGVWRSDDGGFSWKLLWQNSDIEAIFTIFVHPNNPTHLMVGTSGQGVYESLDGGATWYNAGLQGCHVKQIDLYP